MTTTYSVVPLSTSTDFRGIKITATSLASGVTLHAAQAGTLPDLVCLEAYNSDTVARPLKLGWGGVTEPDDVLAFLLLAGQTILIVHQRPIRNSLVIKAASETLTWIDGVSYAGAANVVVITGGSYVQRQLT